jgi:hypothetical protein
MIDHKELLQHFRYDPDTGEFHYRKGNKAGKTTGHDCHGYCRIHFKGKFYIRSRLAFFYMTGRFPTEQIDHRDRNRSNDRWDNLRECDNAHNNANRPAFKNNKSGIKGVSFDRGMQQWRASISVKSKSYYLGCFDTVEAAQLAYLKAATEHFGEFAST